jgi:hypothetical protein
VTKAVASVVDSLKAKFVFVSVFFFVGGVVAVFVMV